MFKKRLFICTLSGALIVAAIGCGRGKKTVQTNPVSTAPAATIQHGSKNILGGAFKLGPGKYKIFSVPVTAAMKNPSVAGNFRASGGKNGIEVLVLEVNQYPNWQNGRKFSATYSSGRTSAGELDIQLPEEPGTYYVVFSNRFSSITNKAVEAVVKLQYNQGG
jgi:hypothetical protein